MSDILLGLGIFVVVYLLHCLAGRFNPEGFANGFMKKEVAEELYPTIFKKQTGSEIKESEDK